jgi:hypothetical protein
MAARGAPAVAEPQVEYLSDVLDELLLMHTQAWGELGIDTATHAPDKTPRQLQIKDTFYDKGLGHHANGEMILVLEGQYLTFETEVGVLWQSGDTGTVVFQVFVDDEQRFDSGVMRERDEAKPVRVSVEGAQILRLVATDAGDGITCDCACWADARLTRNPQAEPPSVEGSLDIAPFGSVVTFDPHRTDGAHSNRVQEFRAEDAFLHTDLPSQADGTYVAPVAEDGTGCIGLQWVERRFVRELGLHFAGAPPSPEGVRLEAWIGQSWWQGNWHPLHGRLEAQRDEWVFRVSWKDSPELRGRGTQKVRWLFPATEKPIALRRLSARTRSVWDTVQLRLQPEYRQPGQSAEIEVYNGAIIDPDGSPYACVWDLGGPLELTVRCSRPMPLKSDRTVLRFQLPSHEKRRATALAVAVEDVLADGCVYVPETGLFVAPTSADVTLARYKRAIRDRRTILERVPRRPDQTFAKALAAVHNPIQDNGPTLLSLACDNRKFQVQREGAIQFSTVPDDPRSGRVNYPVELRPRFASGDSESLKRHLHGGWLPIPVSVVEEGGITYQQRTFVAPFGQRKDLPLCVAEFTVENRATTACNASFSLSVLADRTQGKAAAVQAVPAGTAAQDAGRLLAFVSLEEASALSATVEGNTIHVSGELPPGTPARVVAYLPGWELKPEGLTALTGCDALLAETEGYWTDLLADTMQIDIPDPLLANVIRASQLHCLLAARSEADGARIAPWIASDRYGPLESEANSIILGMDSLGHGDFSRRSLDFFINRYNDAGYLTTGYTMMGTGWHLWTLAEHWRLTRDEEWLRRVAPEVARVCEWVVRQREKTKRLGANGEKVPDYGLMPPGVVADWGVYAHRFFMDAHYCAGLQRAAQALADIGHPGADRLLEDAEEYRQDILRAYHWAQARAPARALQDGTYLPACPAMVYCFGDVGESFVGEDWGRSWAGDVEIGPHHLVALGVMDPAAPDAEWMMQHLEDDWCLHEGMNDYPEARNREDWFNLGGFTKMQPYYTRMTQVYALRDEAKPFIRSYLNAIPSLLSLENLSFWEHFRNAGAWNKTHETGWFLQQTRTMFVMERGGELWLAPFVPNHWMGDGMEVRVARAPSHFGAVSYEIESNVDADYIEAEIDPPTRNAPEAIVIRLRHPKGKRMKSTTVNGEPHEDFDPKRECVRLKPGRRTITVRASY